MASRRLLLLALVVILSLVGATGIRGAVPSQPAAAEALAGASTVVGSATVPVGTFATERVLCPPGTVALGGGVDLDNVLLMKVTSSGPVFDADQARLIFQDDGAQPAPVGWQASALNNSITDRPLKVAVICAPLPGVSTVVASATVPDGSFAVRNVACPAGTIATGGGIDLDNVLLMEVTSSGPAFDASQQRLLLQDDGTHPAPTGWQASAVNNTVTDRPLKLAAICAPLAGVSTVVGSATVSGGNFATERVLCPAGTIATGGGVDLYNVAFMKVTSSGPTFAADQQRLIFQDDGVHPAPVGWQASALNETADDRDLKAAVMCVAAGSAIYLPLIVR